MGWKLERWWGRRWKTLNAIFFKAFHEGGVVGAVEGLALSSGAFPLWNALDDKLKHAKTNA